MRVRDALDLVAMVPDELPESGRLGDGFPFRRLIGDGAAGAAVGLVPEEDGAGFGDDGGALEHFGDSLRQIFSCQFF